MNDKPPPTILAQTLEAEMRRLNTNDHALAKSAGLKQDAVRDVMRGKTTQPAADKLAAIARVLGRTTEQLLDGSLLQSQPYDQNSADVEARIVIWEGRPLKPHFVDDPDKLALLRMWDSLSFVKRAALFGYLGLDDMPSAPKPK